MAITTLAGMVTGCQWPRPFTKVSASVPAMYFTSHWGIGGNPAAGSYDATLNGVALSSPQTGQLHFSNPASGNTYLANLKASMSQEGLLYLCDRLWHNGGFTITSTSAQNITSPTWPARDDSGSTNGVGVLLGVEVSSATGTGTPTITVGYTNSSNTSGRTGTNIHTTVANSGAGRFYPIGLQAGDVGVRSVQSLTLSATWTSGTINLVAYRILGVLDVPSVGRSFSLDPTSCQMARMYADSVPFTMAIATSTFTMSGTASWSQG